MFISGLTKRLKSWVERDEGNVELLGNSSRFVTIDTGAPDDSSV
ncbi:MAG TPA: hypothetical protein VKC60_13570 [Opitutaceae bacterium]|nr:hypothetical protein [Opitutaceae bacterium]